MKRDDAAQRAAWERLTAILRERALAILSAKDANREAKQGPKPQPPK